MAMKMRPLFAIAPKPEPKPIVENTSTVAARSELMGWVSIYQPSDSRDRFVLIGPDGNRFACKFYNSAKDEFIGQSFLSMHNLKEHFDRNIIPKNESL